MLKKRIVPCLDIKNGRTVKGIKFEDIIDAGDPVEQAKLYAEQGADELVFLDITATVENRDTLIDLVSKVAAEINIPFTVGGGIKSVEDVSALLNAGADKVSINSSAVKRPELISEIAGKFGNQCVVLAIDTKKIGDHWLVCTHGGRQMTDIKTLDWVKQVEQLGAGEILLTSMDHDGTKDGFALELLSEVNKVCNLPIIASGGAGKKNHFTEALKVADAALAASVFHFGEILIPELKDYLKTENIAVR